MHLRWASAQRPGGAARIVVDDGVVLAVVARSSVDHVVATWLGDRRLPIARGDDAFVAAVIRGGVAQVHAQPGTVAVVARGFAVAGPATELRMAPGDVLVLLAEPADLTSIAVTACASISPAAAAERMGTCAVVRCDAFDVPATIAQLVADYTHPEHTWLGAWAKQHGALPVELDAGGVLALRPDGGAISTAWADPEHTAREETKPGRLLLAATAGARNFPALAPLRPERPERAAACTCEAGCLACWYLGWSLPVPAHDDLLWR